jgi:hypothetical protein
VQLVTPPLPSAEANKRVELHLFSALGLRPVEGLLYLYMYKANTNNIFVLALNMPVAL